MPSVQDCLAELGCDMDLLQTCQTLSEEWALVRKAYFRKVLKSHPDKGEWGCRQSLRFPSTCS